MTVLEHMFFVNVLCKCPKENPRIPDIEAAWLSDQRMRDGSNKPKFMMKGIDWETAEAQQKQVNRIEAKKKAEKNREAEVQKKADDVLEVEDSNVEEPSSLDDDRDKDFVRNTKAKPKQISCRQQQD